MRRATFIALLTLILGEIMYNQPLVAVDTIPFRFKDNQLQVGVIKRQNEPFKGERAIPGLILDGLEKLEHAHYRAIKDKFGISQELTGAVRSVGAFDTSDRDPRGPTISVCSYIIINPDAESEEAEWFSLGEMPKLPFDHNDLISIAAKAIKQALFSDIEVTKNLLGETFTTDAAKRILEQAGTIQDGSNTTRKLRSQGYLEEGEPMKQKKGRPLNTWRFK